MGVAGDPGEGAGLRRAVLALSAGLTAICRPARSLGRGAAEDRRSAVARGGGAEFRIGFRGDQTLAHLAENLGLPRCEIGAARIDGEDVPLGSEIPDLARIELAGADETPPRPGAEPGAGRPPRFVLDVHLGRLARDLRLLGFDVLWTNALDDPAIERIAASEGRVILTRDRGLLFRKSVRAAMLVRSRDPYEQLVDAARRFALGPWMRPFSLCASCGDSIAPAPKAGLLDLVPAIVSSRYDEFFACPSCGKIYWRGDHFRNIEPFLRRLFADLGLPPGFASGGSGAGAR